MSLLFAQNSRDILFEILLPKDMFHFALDFAGKTEGISGNPLQATLPVAFRVVKIKRFDPLDVIVVGLGAEHGFVFDEGRLELPPKIGH